MRQRADDNRQLRHLPLGGIRPEEEDLVRIVLGLKPQAIRREREPGQQAAQLHLVTSPRYLAGRIGTK